jgi:2-polyprenyl-3-methyl-5-hydroxy-6-metoxy-1,4-benzoquinol methylase
MQPSKSEVEAGQAVYTRGTLSVYDIVVLGISNSFIWKCPSVRIEQHYNENVSDNHLEVGVGTGYFPDRCHFPSQHPRVGLMDMNPNTLVFASKRIARYRPETYIQNVLEPIDHELTPFDSIGINYLFHCVPGSMTEKAVVFDHLVNLMKPGCQVFGSTILQGGVSRNWTARKLMSFYNKKGIFSNERDDLEGLESALSERFDNVEIEVVGCVALFSAKYT